MSGFISVGWLVEALIASSILMAFVLLCRKEAQRALGPQLAYWLWALPVLRMAMPPLPASWRESAVAPLSAASETVMVLFEPVIPAASDPASFPWLVVFAAAWGLGALAFFAWHGLSHFSYVRRIVSPPASHETLPDGTTLVESDEAIGPVAFGVLKRFVAVPRDFAERYDADERKLALVHELGHHARGDLIANWIALAMLAVHWFNPLAWVAYRKFRSDQEMANDARVLAALPVMQRHAYACAIVKAAHGRAITAACHLHTIEDLKGRLKMLKASRKSRRVLMAGAVGIASLTAAGLGLTASGAAAEKIRTVATTQVAAMTQVAAPAAPTPPAAVDDAWPETDAPQVKRAKKVVVVNNGKSVTYEGAEADAYLAAHPEIAHNADLGRDIARDVSRHRIVIRDKDGKARTYVGPEADAYLRAHPGMRPPMPPMPPVVGMVAPQAPGAPDVFVSSGPDGKRVIRRNVRPGAYIDGAPVPPGVMMVTSGDCRGGDAREFVQRDTKDGKSRIVICEKRIERFADAQARIAVKRAELEARHGMSTGYDRRSALFGLNAGRSAILNTPGMTDEQRSQALAGIDQARAEIEREIREDKRD